MILEVKDLSKSFESERVLDKLSFNLEDGQIHGLVGRNGSGKTTLLKILVDILNMDEGSLKILGKSYKEDRHIIENIAYLPDRFDYFDYDSILKIKDYYKILYPNFDDNFFKIELKKNKIDGKKTLRSFSKGYKNLIGLLAIIASNARIVLLDEILDGMDVLNKELIISYILDMKDQGRTVLASSHELEELAKIVDVCLYLTKDGKIRNISKSKNSFIKVQIVVKDKLDEAILNHSVLRFNMGRVYVILLENKDNIRNILDENKTIVQYDILDSKIEDSFYWEKGRSK
ncbi:ATP-binding cassette domain-containing protein [Anaerococcus sp. AGMB00486]|uniref:ATP-binding cassette domain-containing protein n=2 Tax=Anaerococcus TaxID=165779 RepID=A0ABX2NCP6_9FIRM|nr:MULTISPECIES: ATP-binding cassette domain-containing protein [Anaerococcus]MDY3006870.1 ATP-binding cassette domain-containing protein [Anaerococcus porci]MSS77803.1 ATP-binding cassette domain-containing protein [Anaerococcus porci]NVF12237.1 ATP-binding cassette domain-containing protein [Anaerococcus faecalis]